MVTYIFQRGNTVYIFHEESEEEAWEKLQSKLSWNMKIVKQRCQLIKSLGVYERGITEIKTK